MIGSIGVGEMLIILVIALIIFGPRKLPELGRSLGKSLGEFKRASNDLRNTLDEEIRVEEHRERTEGSAKQKSTPAPEASSAAAPKSAPATSAAAPAKSAPTASAAASTKSAAAAVAAPASGVHPTEPDVGT